jgi:hypothetical protein
MPEPGNVIVHWEKGRVRSASRPESGTEIAHGGGGPHNPDMELERRVSKLEDAVTAIRLDIAEMKGKISNLPTTWQLIGVNFGLVIGVAALVFAIARSMR